MLDLCHECAFRFPFISIKYYPELWDRKETADWFTAFDVNKPLSKVWFSNNNQRKTYVKKALNLLTIKTN